MKKTITVLSLCAMLLALCFSASAQQPVEVPRIGYIFGSSLSAMTYRAEAFRQGLRELGYVEERTIVIEWRYGEGKSDRVTELVAELVHLKVDVIVTGGASVTQAAKKATSTIPIVMAQVRDPVGSGFVASLARPGRNITGLSTLSPELGGKRLELVKEIVPGLSRVAVLGNSTVPGNVQELREIKLAVGALGVKLQYIDVLDPKDFDTAFRRRAGGVLMHSL
jgi:putative ABC transport system substrate-binding protein